MNIKIPDLSMVVLIGVSGCGKSTFGRTHFLPTEVVSSDACRGFVSDDESDQSATSAAFELLHTMLRLRLAKGRLTVVDATNVQAASRKALIDIAREHHMLPIAIVFKIDERICQERNTLRPDRNFGPHVIRRQAQDLYRSLRGLRKEGFRNVHFLESPEEVAAATITREPLWNNKKTEHGPFDIIGDVHGCLSELRELLVKLEYQPNGERFDAPEGRKAIFLGDLVDRGPDSPGVLRLVRQMTASGSALAVPGNHDIKLLRHLKGQNVSISHGLDKTLSQLKKVDPSELVDAISFIDGLVSHYVLDDGNLVVAHAGMKESMQGRGSGAVREFALYGETTGETDEFGLPVRVRWAENYRGKAMVVYGHTPVVEPDWLNNTLCIDTGCVFGGKLTALRYPEKEIVQVEAKAEYATPARPLEPPPAFSSQQMSDDILDIDDVRGRQHIRCEEYGNIVIPEENASAALEAISRFAADPQWLVYLPPTMSPSETSALDGYLEHPAEAFAYFASEGVERVVCEEKHMGSRTVVAIGRSEEAVVKRFGVEGSLGRILTRSGRPFFDDPAPERELLERLGAALEEAGVWEELSTDWAVLDCELLPWSSKAQQLLRTQYAPLGAAANVILPESLGWLKAAQERLGTDDLNGLVDRWETRTQAAEKYVSAYRQYCWQVTSITDYKLAPFHIMATEGAVHNLKSHRWHMETIGRICQADPAVLLATPWMEINPTDPASVAEATEWWTTHTAKGGEGMVIKPMDFTVRGPKGMVQPALKCRGQEYLRIIYGPEYLFPENLSRLRRRGLARKRALALREFALGIEGLRRFVNREPLRRVHQCAFGVLAIESDPVDPRL